MFKSIKLIIILVMILGLCAWIFYSYQITAPASKDNPNIEFTIEPGWGVNRISQELLNLGLIRNQFYFEVYVWLKDLQRNFQSGKHTISASMNIKEIVNSLIKGGGKEKVITILEGWNNQEIADYLENQNVVDEINFLGLANHKLAFTDEYTFLNDKPSTASLEGYLFPDTYRVFADATAEEIIQKMLDNFSEKLNNNLRTKIKDQDKTIFEVITLASIIEKEVRKSEDMKMVADIFYKRLASGIALQSDATINYITHKGMIQPTYADTEIDNPYNTYKYRGLTPGPISNPGLNAIMATIEPTANDYYYFLTTKDTGEVIYSKTYEEHLKNKAKYLN